MGLKDTFKKQGGMSLLKQYWKNGSFFTAASQFLLLGKGRTALEILRLSAWLKTKQKLEKKYRSHLAEFDRIYDTALPHESSNKVWICWFQGMENAPKLVQKCYQSVKENMPNREIIVLTTDNIKDYITFPDYIMEKWKSGVITHTHMTDLLRIELLIKYGGMWLDATFFCSSGKIAPYFFDSDLFFYQCLKPGRDGHCTYMSSWLMSAKTYNKILMATQFLCYEYWKENDSMVDYFLLHNFMSVVLDYYPEDWNKIVPRDNATPHELLLRLFEPYDEKIWTAIREQTPFHKLSYKFEKEKQIMQNTYYSRIIGGVIHKRSNTRILHYFHESLKELHAPFATCGKVAA